MLPFWATEGEDMPFFIVACFADGKSDENPRRVEAHDKLQAAEDVCGGSLIEGPAKLGNLRATVRPLDNPNDVTTFRER